MAKYAKYVGTAYSRADMRIMTREQWAVNGIDQETLVWNEANGYTVPIEQIGEQARSVLELDPGIIFTDEAPDEEAIRTAKVDAARKRLEARKAGLEVLHNDDTIPASLDDSRTE